LKYELVEIMKKIKVYITSIKQISAQQPLVDDWFEHPVFYTEPYIRALEPDYKQFFTPNEVRRLGKILKRALIVSRQAMLEGGVPDAIITGTGLGCIENTEIFLNKLVREGEEMLNPTFFMQSTHNTISSLIAIDAKCYAYNNTYSHKGISFECALQDAFLQCRDVDSSVTTALVGAHDEMTPDYFTLLKKGCYLGIPNQTFAGETAVAMMLSTEKTENSLCEIEEVEKFYTGTSHERLNPQSTEIMGWQNKSEMTENIDAIMIGVNNVAENDKIYYENCARLFPGIPLLQYKNIFGESYTAPALGVYAAAICLQKGKIPEHLKIKTSDNKTSDCKKLDYKALDVKLSGIGNAKKKILCYNHFEGKNHTFILLSK